MIDKALEIRMNDSAGVTGMLEQAAKQAKQASVWMASLTAVTKNQALAAIAVALKARQSEILRANEKDKKRAEEEMLNPVLKKRLKFDDAKLRDAITGIESLIGLADPVGITLRSMELDRGLELYKVSCPIGVLGIVFESRPDALVQISTLALKSGNAVLLKGGTEALHTNRALADIMYHAAVQAGLPEGWMALLETRQDVQDMLRLDAYIDLIIPRGSNAFVRYIMDHTRIPVLGHADGICHVYIDRDADIEKAVRIAVDSKCQYPAVCNAMETLLVDKPVAGDVLCLLKAEYGRLGVELRGDDLACAVIEIDSATEEDWSTEYNDLILSIKIVDGLAEAIEHINTYGSNHTDAIVTENADTAKQFLSRVDSANVFWNCSTRFSDGYRYGLGAEVGISTNKIHARGPVGLEGLVIYKWILLGNGQTVADYAGPGAKPFTHKPLHKPYSL